ncbi:hypothetical protein QAD02_003250 [Eretmocerus hayati]|uniref:Uncharacterized protein n=1 Tax=Eretmocerus hayati TaxID=131215 RepID=A0ACC2NLJ6_9HYME|nr:hypothetical protein QAD02_003250 [Eretmocerus hayati]
MANEGNGGNGGNGGNAGNVGNAGNGGNAGEADNIRTHVESIARCRIPPFWKDNLELWFFQIESVFHSNNVRSDNSKYHLAVGALNPEALHEIADVLRAPPAEDKYTHLKEQIMNRFALSEDKQLHKLLTDIQLGSKKPSQLLRGIRALAGKKASEDVLRIKWLALLPANTQRFLKIFRGTDLDELASAADELLEVGGDAFVMSTFYCERSPARSATNSEAGSIKSSLSQLISLTREVLVLLGSTANANSNNTNNSRSRSRARSLSPASPCMCYYHKKFGADAQRCLLPCTLKKSEN